MSVSNADTLPISGDMDPKDTLSRLQKLAYWPKMAVYVKRYCKMCFTCLKYKSQGKVLAPLRKFKDVKQSWEWVHLDNLGPFSYPEAGN
ncbi:hypothetical protein SK128_004816, partial [Halocaridina rubra]